MRSDDQGRAWGHPLTHQTLAPEGTQGQQEGTQVTTHRRDQERGADRSSEQEGTEADPRDRDNTQPI